MDAMSTHDCIGDGTHRAGKFCRRVAIAALLAAAPMAWCGSPTVGECLEGADFIANAASARDNGMSREAFLRRLDDDLTLIHVFPPELRWFAKDEDDERLLQMAARQVFDQPESRESHRARFLDACFARVSL
jgi:hypothetical protein